MVTRRKLVQLTGRAAAAIPFVGAMALRRGAVMTAGASPILAPPDFTVIGRAWMPTKERDLWRWWLSDEWNRREAPEAWYFDTRWHNEILRDHDAEAATLATWPIYRVTGRRSVEYQHEGEIIRGPWRTQAEIDAAVRDA